MIANIKDFKEILSKYSDCGSEKEYAEFIAEKLSAYTGKEGVSIDCLNNAIGFVGTPSKHNILLEAHMDEISLIVAKITEEGFLMVRNVGGIDLRAILSTEVMVNGLTGIVANIPPHLAKDGKSIPKYADLYIDLGLPVEEVNNIVQIGDRVSILAESTELLNNRIAAKALDNKACVYTILITLKKLEKEIRENTLDCCISVLFASQEEIGSRGAIVGSYEINADEAIVLDTTFANQTDHKGNVELGKGVVIERSAYYDRKMINSLVQAANKLAIPYQTDISVKANDTDAHDINLSNCGVPTVLMSIPIKYMHTPVEVADLNDIENAADIIAEYIKTKFSKEEA